MYCFNNVVVVDNHGLFIFVGPSFAGSFHDVRCLRNTEISIRWRDFFANDPDSHVPLQYLLGDPGYVGLEQFILRRVDRREVPNVDSDPLLRAFNKRHAGQRIAVEWGIGGLKSKFKKFLGIFGNRRDRFGIMFRTAAILTNFIHRRRQDFEVVEMDGPPEDEGAVDAGDGVFANEWA
jgi:hypothetical protein